MKMIGGRSSVAIEDEIGVLTGYLSTANAKSFESSLFDQPPGSPRLRIAKHTATTRPIVGLRLPSLFPVGLGLSTDSSRIVTGFELKAGTLATAL